MSRPQPTSRSEDGFIKSGMAILVLWLIAPGALWAQSQSEMDLAAGIRLVKTHDYKNGLIKLDGVTQRLLGRPDSARALGFAYLYMGVAYLGLGQEPLGKQQFREAFAFFGKAGINVVDMALDPDEFPSHIVAALEEARQNALHDRPLAASAETPQDPAPMKPTSTKPAPATEQPKTTPPPTAKKEGGSRTVPLLVAAGAAAAGSVALVAAGGGDGSTSGAVAPTSASPTPSPAATDITLLSASPGSGATLSFIDRDQIRMGLALTLRVVHNEDVPRGYLALVLFRANDLVFACASGLRDNITLRAGQAETFEFPYVIYGGAPSCPLPATTTSIQVKLVSYTASRALFEKSFALTYNLTR